MNKASLSIGIAAYNAEKNIANMLRSLLKQRHDGFVIEQILVHCDQCTDRTLEIVKTFKNNGVKILESPQRRGFAGSVKILLESTDSGIMVLLNDDIKITDAEFIKKLTLPFRQQRHLGLVGGSPRPLLPRNFAERAAVSSFKAWDIMRMKIKGGNNIFSVDGKVLALSREFVSILEFPKDLRQMGNVDAYLYMECLLQGFLYYYARSAEAYYRYPSSFREYIEWTARNNSNQDLLKKRFGFLVDREYAKPQLLYWRCMLSEFLKNPLASCSIFMLGFYIRYKAKKKANNFNSIWTVITTSKNLE